MLEDDLDATAQLGPVKKIGNSQYSVSSIEPGAVLRHDPIITDSER